MNSLLINLTNNWENHFRDNPTNEVNNKTMVQLMESFGAGIPTADCLVKATEEQDMVFMAKAPVSNHILFLHHFTKIGGMRINPATKSFAIEGFGAQRYPTQGDHEPMFSPYLCQIPIWTIFTSLTSAENVIGLQVRANAVQKPFQTCTPVHPFLASFLTDQGGRSIPDLVMTAIAQTAAFNDQYAADADYPAIEDTGKSIINWLWAASHAEFPTVPVAPSIDPSIQTRYNAITLAYILPPAPTVNPEVVPGNQEAVLQQLASNISDQTNVLQKINNIAETKHSEKNKSKGIATIHPYFRKILAVSSPDGEEVSLDPSE